MTNKRICCILCLNWENHIKTGIKVVKDKNGHTRYNKNGMPIIRKKYKTEKMHNSCVYMVDSLETFRHTDAFCLGAYVLFENSSKWQYVHLGGTKFFDELNKFIVRNVLEYSRNNHIEIIRIHTAIEEPCINGNKLFVPKRRGVQKEYIFRGYGYAIRSDIINEDVKPRIPIVHTNLDKCKANTTQHERYASPYQWEYGSTPKKSGNIEIVAAMNSAK